MCNISEGVVEKWFRKGYEAGIKNSIREGFETGKKREAIRSIINVMKNMSLTFDQAVSALDIPENERAEYRKLVDKQLAEFDLR